MSIIFDGIFLGNWQQAQDKKMLEDNNISHILSCAPAVDRFHPNNFVYKTIGILDMDQFDPYPLQEEAVDFIVKSFREDKATGILIHGFKESDPRPVGVLLAYTIREKNLNVTLAMELIQRKNPGARIEERWLPILKRYYNDFCTKTEAKNKQKLLAEFAKKKFLVQRPVTQKSLKSKVDGLVSHDPKEKTGGFNFWSQIKNTNVEDKKNVEELPEIVIVDEKKPQQEDSPEIQIRDTSKESIKNLTNSNFKEITKQRLRESRAKLDSIKYISSPHLPESFAYKYDQNRKHNCVFHPRKQDLLRQTQNGNLNDRKSHFPKNKILDESMNKTGINNMFTHKSQPKLMNSLEATQLLRDEVINNPFKVSRSTDKVLQRPYRNFISEYKEKYASKFFHHRSIFLELYCSIKTSSEIYYILFTYFILSFLYFIDF